MKRFTATLMIAAAIIAAARLTQEKNFSTPRPRLKLRRGQKCGLALLILERALR